MLMHLRKVLPGKGTGMTKKPDAFTKHPAIVSYTGGSLKNACKCNQEFGKSFRFPQQK